MPGVVIQTADNNAAERIKNQRRILSSRIFEIAHFPVKTPLNPLTEMSEFGKRSRRHHSTKIEPQQTGLLADPLCIGNRHGSIVPETGFYRQTADEVDPSPGGTGSRPEPQDHHPFLFEDYCLVVVEQDPILYVPAHGTRKHDLFKITTFFDQIFEPVAM